LQATALGGGATTAKTASYTLVAADAGTVVQMNSASATTITVNTALFAQGDTVQIQNVGNGVCTVTAGTATVSTAGSLALSQYECGQLYFNTTSAALFFDVVQGAGMTNPMTTTGDIIYSSSGSTPARLVIGTTGQVVTVASGLPSWATPSGGASMTLLHTVTLSTTSHTQASISQAYKNLYIVGRQIGASAGAAFRLRIHARTSDYIYASIITGTLAAGGNTGFDSQTNAISTDNGSAFQFTFYDYAETASEKVVIGQIVGNATGDTTNIMGSPFNHQTAISSLTFTTVAGTANLSGTILIYGVS